MFNKLIRKNDKKINNHLDERKENAQKEQLPSHIAIIMDGNGRWAKKRALPRIASAAKRWLADDAYSRFANAVGIDTLTLYAFSTENWKRPKTEVEFLMRLPEEFLGTYLPELIEQNVQVRMMGNHEMLPDHTKRAIYKAMEETANNDGLILNFAMNYGSRDEIVQAVKSIAAQIQQNEISEDEISEELLSSHLMTKDLTEPDLLIRTSGEVRLSNFMLWQLAYTEFWFTDTLWPDFDEACLLDAIESYQKRNRRYGGLKGEEIN